MLGAPVSYWDLNGSVDDVVVYSLLMALTVPTAEQYLSSSFDIVLAYIIPAVIYRCEGRSTLFHPLSNL